MAFHDALSENGSATERMGNAGLPLIASALVKAVRDNAGMDWWHFEQRRKKVRITIRRILRKNGHPPDLEDAAIRTVVLQAEALAAEVRSWGDAPAPPRPFLPCNIPENRTASPLSIDPDISPSKSSR